METSLLGTWIGGYRVERLLGEGGMGQVYEAHNPQIDERLAIKVLHAELTTRNDIRGRFVLEAIAAAKVKHENVVEVRDVATLPDGRVYIALQYLEGMDLEKYTHQRGGRLGELDVALIIGQVCCALHEAHLKGIVHRDLKPANVFITSDRRRDTLVKLLDFGIAHVKNAVKSQTMMTGDKQVLGTPAYMAPEQIVSPRSVDQRADIFALGCMIYQLVTGSLPFNAETLEGIVLAKKEQPPKPPTSLVPGLSPVWDVIASRCLGWEAITRYPNVHMLVLDMVDGVEGVCAGIDGAAAEMESAWPSFRKVASDSDETRRAQTATGGAASVTAPGLMTTSISGAAGERMAAVATSSRAGTRTGKMIAIGSVVAAAMTAGIIGVARMSGGTSSHEASGSVAQPAPLTRAPTSPPAPSSAPLPATPPPSPSTSPPAPSPSVPPPPAPNETPTTNPPPSPQVTTSPTNSTQPRAPRADSKSVKKPATPSPTMTTPKPDAMKPKTPTTPKHVDPDGVM